jgi:hypothetical protein
MRKRLCLFAILAVAMVCVGSPAAGQDYSLDEASAKSLKPEAAEAYKAGQKLLDHVDYAEGLKSLQKAAELDPAHVAIRFLVAKLATAESRKKNDPNVHPNANDLLTIAEKAYEEIIALESHGASLADVQRAQKSLATIQGSKAALASRDARLENIGNAIIQQRAKEVFIGDEERRKKEEEKKTREAAQRAAKAGPQAQGAGR